MVDSLVMRPRKTRRGCAQPEELLLGDDVDDADDAEVDGDVGDDLGGHGQDAEPPKRRFVVFARKIGVTLTGAAGLRGSGREVPIDD